MFVMLWHMVTPHAMLFRTQVCRAAYASLSTKFEQSGYVPSDYVRLRAAVLQRNDTQKTAEVILTSEVSGRSEAHGHLHS